MPATLGQGIEEDYRMKFMISIFVLLLTALNSYSDDIAPADADYCIDWIGDEKNFNAQLVLVKKYNDLKIRRNTQEPLKCMGHYSRSDPSRFYFIDTSGREVFAFQSLGGIDSRSVGSIGRCGPYESSPWCGRPELAKILQPEIQINFPDTTGTISTSPKELNEYKKEDLLQLKGKIIDAHIKSYIMCSPDLDTVYQIDFRVRIVGWCGRGGQVGR